MSSGERKNPYYPGPRFETVSEKKPIISKYDFPSAELVDLQKRDISPFTRVDLDLTVAPPVGGYKIQAPGRGFFGIMEVNGIPIFPLTAAVVEIRVGANQAANAFPMKNGRGYKGEFLELYLNWTVQPAGSVLQLFVLHYDDQPYPFTF